MNLIIKEIKTEEETATLTKKLAERLKDKIIFLNGEIGAGKTTFVKYLAYNLGFKEDISSPTFSIVNRYEYNNKIINHLDLYRLEDESELDNIGFYEMINYKETVIIEWANKFNLQEYIRSYIVINIEKNNDETRRFIIDYSKCK